MRARRPRLALGLVLGPLLAAAAGCYDTPTPDCAFECGEDNACPEDYGCASDGWCKRVDLPDDHVCEAEEAAERVLPASEKIESLRAFPRR